MCGRTSLCQGAALAKTGLGPGLARLKSSFTLGLTATPERTDGVDVATLFDDILAAQATIGDGIAEGSLVPFRYRGLKDDVDFERIPWRNGRFDVGELEAALESAPRMAKEDAALFATTTLVLRRVVGLQKVVAGDQALPADRAQCG